MILLRLTAAFLLFLVLTMPSSASGDESGDEAIRLGKIGLERFERADWEGALESFVQADSSFHSPVFVMYKARCLRNLGRLVEARDVYAALLAEPLSADAPPPWVTAHATATTELAALVGEIPRIVVSLHDPTSTSELFLDGARIEPEITLPANPGAHLLSARGRAGSTELPIVVLRTQELQRFSIAPPSANPPPTVKTVLTGTAGLGITFTTAGGAALVAAIVTGVLALDANADADAVLAERCSTPTTCPAFETPTVEAAIRDAEQLAHATDGLLISGGVTLVVGVVLLLALPLEEVVVEPTSRGLAIRF
jgi:hypothetical protein